MAPLTPCHVVDVSFNPIISIQFTIDSSEFQSIKLNEFQALTLLTPTTWSTVQHIPKPNQLDSIPINSTEFQLIYSNRFDCLTPRDPATCHVLRTIYNRINSGSKDIDILTRFDPYTFI